MNYFIILAIVIPFLFLVGVIYNALKEQKKLESETLPKFLAQRQAQGNHYSGDSYDADDDYGRSPQKDPTQSAPSVQKSLNALNQTVTSADLVASIAAAVGSIGVAEAQEAIATRTARQEATVDAKGDATSSAPQLAEEREPSREQERGHEQAQGRKLAHDADSTGADRATNQDNSAATTFSEDSPLLAAAQQQPLGDSNFEADSAAAYFARYHSNS